jgi:hypothetical protein
MKFVKKKMREVTDHPVILLQLQRRVSRNNKGPPFRCWQFWGTSMFGVTRFVPHNLPSCARAQHPAGWCATFKHVSIAAIGRARRFSTTAACERSRASAVRSLKIREA